MRFVVTAGGTAGHIYPALAVAQGLIAEGHELFFAGTPQGQESKLIPAEGIAYEAFSAVGFKRSKPLSLPAFAYKTLRATQAAKQWLATIQPHAVAGFGGYASVPVSRAAQQLHIPVLVHEQNSRAGWANRMLARKATAVALTYDACRAQMTHAHTQRVEVTGNPVRQSFLELLDTTRRAEARAAFRACYGIADDAVVLMVFGGSQGARSINDAVLNNAPRILESASHVLHLTGASQLDAVETQLAQSLSAEQLKRWHALGYCNQMDAAFVASDLVLSRAGASSLAEIAALGMPACVVPYPYATDDHQTANARALVEAGAARCVPDAELQSPLFMQNLCELLDNATLRCQMAAAARASNAAAATNKLIQLLYHIAQQELRDKHDALR